MIFLNLKGYQQIQYLSYNFGSGCFVSWTWTIHLFLLFFTFFCHYFKCNVVTFRFCRGKSALMFKLRPLWGPRCSHCLHDQINERQIDSFSCSSKLGLSKLVASWLNHIHHFCSHFSWPCLLFFTEISPLVLLVLNLFFALSLWYIFLSVSLHPPFLPPYSASLLFFSLNSHLLSIFVSLPLSFLNMNGFGYLRTGQRSQMTGCFQNVIGMSTIVDPCCA